MYVKDARMVYVTAADHEQAHALGRSMVEQRLAACANVTSNVTSIYRWEGEICEESEAVLILKTCLAVVDDLVVALKKEHSYDCPCIEVFEVERGNEAYFDWVRENTGPES